MTRYYGWYANRPRGTRRKTAAGPADGAAAPIAVAEREALPLGEARRRWAELLRRIYEVDPTPLWGRSLLYSPRHRSSSMAAFSSSTAARHTVEACGSTR